MEFVLKVQKGQSKSTMMKAYIRIPDFIKYSIDEFFFITMINSYLSNCDANCNFLYIWRGGGAVVLQLAGDEDITMYVL